MLKCVCLVTDEIHLTPLSGIAQLRPTLKYLDKIAEKEKQATMRIQQEENKEAGVKDKEEEAKIFQRTIRQSDDKEAIRKIRQGEEEKKYEQEEWVQMAYQDQRVCIVISSVSLRKKC
jgi:FKBP-type peptidyl-prolyl cis-trans isomerase